MTAALDVLTGWPVRLDELFGRISSEFARAEPRRQARKYLEGLLGGAKRKNGWQFAEQIGGARPWRTVSGVLRPRRFRPAGHRPRAGVHRTS